MMEYIRETERAFIFGGVIPLIFLFFVGGIYSCIESKKFVQQCKERKNLSVNMIKKCKDRVWDNEILSQDEISKILRSKN